MDGGTRVEIESKFAVTDEATFAALVELERVNGYRLQPVGERDLTDHYLDTAHRDLLGGGYSCRLREGLVERRFVATVKELGRADDGVHRRQEHECEVARDTPPEEWPECPAREIVTRLSHGRMLAELFALRQHRILRAVEQGERVVAELSLDRVEIEVGGRSRRMHEIEVELAPDGTLVDLRAIGEGLAPYKLEPQPTSKFERVLALLDENDPAPAPKRKRKAPAVRADEPMVEAGRRILKFHYKRMRANEAGTLEGRDSDALHRMRVATRRQRAAFRIVAPYFRRKVVRPFRNELRTAAGCLGAVRDVDVLIEAATRYRDSLAATAARSFDPLLEDWQERRRAAQDQLTTYLNGKDYRAFIDRYKAFLSEAGAGVRNPESSEAVEPLLVRQALPAAVWDHYGRVRAYETVLGWASLETLHTLRIEAKRLRYLLEFFADALGPGSAPAIRALVGLQDHLGELHDADTAIGMIRDFLSRGAKRSIDLAVADAARDYLEVMQVRVRALQRGLTRPWQRVASRRTRLLLARAVATL